MSQTETTPGHQPRHRVMHTMIRVKDMERSLDFYTRLMGMKLLRRKDYPEGRFSLAFVGYGAEIDHAVIEPDPQLGPGQALRAWAAAMATSPSRWTTSTPPARTSRPRAPTSFARPAR